MHGSSEVVGPTFMMRLQPFDRRRMTGFEAGARRRRFFARPDPFPAPSPLPFTSTGGLPRPNFRFEGPPRGGSAPFGRSEAGARVCVKSKRSEILLGENVQKEGRSTGGRIEGKERKTYALLRKFGKVSRTGKRSGRGGRTLSGCGVGPRGGRFRKAEKEGEKLFGKEVAEGFGKTRGRAFTPFVSVESLL